MKRTYVRSRAFLATSALCFVAAPYLRAQTAPAADAEETIILSPFVVESSEDRGYQATTTLAGTRIKTELKDVGSAISVVTKEFLRDTGATSNQSLLQYTTNTEVGGIGGNFAGLGNGQSLDDSSARLSPNTNTRVRGLTSADNTRDYFLTDIAWDSFNTDRIELQRGPNSILFGLGSPAGIINGGLKKAEFRNTNEVEARYGSYGSARGTLDINRVLLKDELAVRIALLDDKTVYRQKPAYNSDQRIYGALRYDPKFLNVNGSQTRIDASYEKGHIKANRPRVIPPGDLITPWWGTGNGHLDKLTIDPRTVGVSDLATINAARAAGDYGIGVRSNTAGNANYNPLVGSFGRNYGGIVGVFSDPNSSDGTLMTTDLGTNRGLGRKARTNSDGSPVLDSNGNQVYDVVTDKAIGGIPWTIMSGIIPFKDYVGTMGSTAYPDQEYGIYKNYLLSDPSIFDFYNKLLDGPNKKEWSNHESYNISLSQTFLNNRMGVSAVYDHQEYDRGQVSMMSDYGQSITIDINRYLPDGSVNPNVGRAAVVSDSISNNSYSSERESARITGFVDVRATDFLDRSLLTSILGRHVFTGLYAQDKVATERRNWFQYAADTDYADIINDTQLKNRAIGTLTYLGGSLAGLSSASGANIPNLTAVQEPMSGNARIYNSNWNSNVDPLSSWTDQYGNASVQAENPANYVGWVNQPITIQKDPTEMVSSANLAQDKIESSAFVWQGFFWDGVIVPTFGYRNDHARSFTKSGSDSDVTRDDGTIDVNGASWHLPKEASATVQGSSRSWSIVLHTPSFVRNKLPWGLDLSLFYNQSDNFQPAAGRVNALGDVLPPPTGKTKDVGFIINALDDRIVFKVNKYETTVKNDALTDFSGSYMLPAAESWGYMYGKQFQARVGNFVNGYKAQPGLVDPATGVQETDAKATADGDLVTAAFFASTPNDKFYETWGIDRSQWSGWMGWSTPSGMTITGDTKSEGYEYELTAAITRNWNLTVNASKVSAQRTNMAQSYADYVEARWVTYNTPVAGTTASDIGDVRLWTSDYNAGESVKGKFGREFMTPYTLYRLQEGSDVPELRPWHLNIVTNYRFDRGLLKGVNVGGGLRWQDRSVIGYKLKDTGDPLNPKSYDLENPYMGPSETNVDLWIGYEKQLTSKIHWRTQLNLRNVTTKKELIPLTADGYGNVTAGRIPDLFTWTLSNTFTF
jgi:outer membrane receptor for ferric coprogen and ferric-rhodotorulic acid